MAIRDHKVALATAARSMDKLNQESINKAQNKRITTSTLISKLALFIAAASFCLTLWQHLQEKSNQQDNLYLRIEPDYRDYETTWDPWGPGPGSIETHWILRIANHSSRTTAIASIEAQATYPESGSKIESGSFNREYRTYDGKVIALPITLDPGSSTSLLLSIYIALYAGTEELREAFPEHQRERLYNINRVVIKYSGYDIFGNRFRESAIEPGEFISGFEEPESNQKILVKVSTTRGTIFAVDSNVAGHHRYSFLVDRN